MKKQTLRKLALRKKTISKFAALDSIRGGATPTFSKLDFLCPPKKAPADTPAGNGS